MIARVIEAYVGRRVAGCVKYEVLVFDIRVGDAKVDRRAEEEDEY